MTQTQGVATATLTGGKTRADAWMLLCKYTENKNLRKHGLGVEAAMRYYAQYFDKVQEEELWGMVGLLHDFDYEKYPSLNDHPYKGQLILEQAGYSELVRHGIMAHAPHTGTVRNTIMEKAIFAVDELSGFIVAVALVKPNRTLAEVEVASVKKKLKVKGFAAGVSRDDVYLGSQELEMTLDEYIGHVLAAMQGIAGELGL